MTSTSPTRTTTPAPWTCATPGSFAWRTCTERWPKIVRALAADVPTHAAELGALADEIAHGALAFDVDEGGRFDVVRAFVGQPWTALPWYVGESFLYARIRAITGASPDPFFAQKQREDAAAHKDIDAARVTANADVNDDAFAASIAGALKRSLWGNRADLSLPQARAHTDDADALLVVDDRAAAVAALVAARRVAIVLDNAGAELAHDLALAALLRRRGIAVTLLAKDVPFFVSDATAIDVARTAALVFGADADRVLAGVDVCDDAFLTGPAFLRSALMPPALAARLAAHDVAIVKGDCNYRRLVGDTPPHDAAFADVVSFPCPLVCLRTLKAEVLCGVDAARAAAARVVDVDWLTSGRFGLVQAALRRA